MQRVEVTGSRIRAVDLETAQPVQVMNAEQIQKTGLVTLGDIVRVIESGHESRVHGVGHVLAGDGGGLFDERPEAPVGGFVHGDEERCLRVYGNLRSPGGTGTRGGR